MQITTRQYLPQYLERIGNQIPDFINNFDFSERNGKFEYLTKASSVYSSNIEGNSVDLNSYMNYELNKKKSRPGREIEEINDLVDTYTFAQTHEFNETNLLFVHKIFSKTILIKRKRGKYRTEQVGVFEKSGLAYLAVEPELVKKEMKVFFADIATLVATSLSEIEPFYFASSIHLRFAHIHPSMYGNGRAARLLEKWFVTSKLGGNFWKIPAEKYYKDHQSRYYKSLNLGVNFYELNYDQCVNFLKMLPQSLNYAG